MKVTDILAGIAIFQKYRLSDHGISAEHDQIIVEYTSRRISEQDLAALHELGWYQPETIGEYDFDEYWVAQV